MVQLVTNVPFMHGVKGRFSRQLSASLQRTGDIYRFIASDPGANIGPGRISLDMDVSFRAPPVDENDHVETVHGGIYVKVARQDDDIISVRLDDDACPAFWCAFEFVEM